MADGDDLLQAIGSDQVGRSRAIRSAVGWAGRLRAWPPYFTGVPEAEHAVPRRQFGEKGETTPGGWRSSRGA